MKNSQGRRLEQYTLKRPQEVLLITAQLGEDTNCIVVYKGFSSSLMRSTAFDPEVPVLPEKAQIVSIDRLASPYNPEAPQYIQQGLTWEEMQSLLREVGV